MLRNSNLGVSYTDTNSEIKFRNDPIRGSYSFRAIGIRRVYGFHYTDWRRQKQKAGYAEFVLHTANDFRMRKVGTIQRICCVELRLLGLLNAIEIGKRAAKW